MIRQDFDALPPKMFMMQIMDEIAKIYCFLWEKKDEQDHVFFSWKDLAKYYNKNTFKTCLRKLNAKGLVNYDERETGIEIELVGWDELSEE